MRNNAPVEHCIAEAFILHREIVRMMKTSEKATPSKTRTKGTFTAPQNTKRKRMRTQKMRKITD